MSQRRKWIAGFLLGDVLLLFLGYAFRVPLLTGLANLWTVNEPVTKVDAIVVLGGGLDYRPMEAARLYREGCAPVVLIMRPGLHPTDKLGITRSEADIAHDLLIKNGVPDSAITVMEDYVANTFEESHAVRNWAQKFGARSFLIPTGIFHTRRVRWIFHKTLKLAGMDVRVIASSPTEYRAENWWRKEAGFIAFQNEVLKFAFYRVRY